MCAYVMAAMGAEAAASDDQCLETARSHELLESDRDPEVPNIKTTYSAMILGQNIK
jgi:hypothetical protein